MGILRLLKFIKVFFSKQQPWQISLGFVLGMFLGLLPSMRPQSLLLLTLAFCLNVNLAAVFLSTSAFYLLGASLDGLLHSLGLWLLQMPSLQPLWTTFYENPLLRTLQLHHTITLGSLLISTILAIPLFLLSQKLLTKTKNFLAQIPLLKLLVPPENNAPTPILRWQGVVALAAFLAILTVGTWAILPKILANQLQTLATSTLHTQVDLHGLSLGWGSAKAEKIEIADSKNLEKNILEIRQPEFSLNPLALLEKKVWIEKANLGQWHLMTKRTQKAKPYQPPQKIKKTPTKTSTSTSIKLWNPFEEINTSQFVSQVLQNETLTSLKEFQALQNKIQLLKQRWQKLLEKPKQKWQELKNRVQQIPKRLLRGEKISLQQIQSEIQSEIQSWQSLRTQLQTELQNLKQDIQDLKKLYQQELQKLQEKYSNLQLTAALFQSAAQKAIHFYLTYLKQIQKLHQSLTHKPKREKGTYLTFGKTKSTPKFLLKEAEFSIHFQNNQLQATLQNLSSSPQLYPHPLTLHV
ncbi:MAG: TIGR03546 family protein, partial [Planctomycetota bacterium]